MNQKSPGLVRLKERDRKKKMMKNSKFIIVRISDLICFLVFYDKLNKNVLTFEEKGNDTASVTSP